MQKGIVFTLDLIICLILINFLFISIDYKDDFLEIYEINNKINDLLICVQITETNDINDIYKITKEVFENKKVYIKLNNKTINEKQEYNQKITNSIKYINSLNKEIYIEIGVYF